MESRGEPYFFFPVVKSFFFLQCLAILLWKPLCKGIFSRSHVYLSQQIRDDRSHLRVSFRGTPHLKVVSRNGLAMRLIAFSHGTVNVCIYIWSLINGWLVGISGSISSSGHLLRSHHLLALFLFIWLEGSLKEVELIVRHFYLSNRNDLWERFYLIICPIGLVCELSIHWDQGQISMPFWLKIWPTLIDQFFWWAWDVLPTTSLCKSSYGKLRS